MMGSNAKKNIFCIVPARAGSKRLQNKNIIDFFGKPLISWTIETALKSKFIDDVYVSTDCDLIATVAKSSGASVPELRPLHLASDTSNLFDVISYHLTKLKILPDYVLLLQPTSPLRGVEDIDAVVSLLKNYDSVVSVSSSPKPASWSQKLNSNLDLGPFFANLATKAQSQQLTQEYFINGAIYATLTSRFLGVGQKLNWISTHQEGELS